MINVHMICCWYKDDIYSHYCHGIVKGLKTDHDLNVKLVTSNCSCFSSSQTFSCSMEELLNHNCDIVKIPYAPLDPTRKYGNIKYYLTKLLKLNLFFETSRGFSFFSLSRRCEVIHFQQVLKSFGFLSFVTLLILSKIFKKKIVVTVHELDPLQEKYTCLNKYYSRADKIIVHSKVLKHQLTGLGIDNARIEIIPYGVSLSPLIEMKRDQFIYFGGHKLLKGKGFYTLLNAMKIIEARGLNLKVVIYTGEGCVGLDEGKKKVHVMGLDKFVTWSEFLYDNKLSQAYQKSMACIIPYTAGFGGYAATSAMANATPVIATRKSSLPEYIGESGIYIQEDSPEDLADAIISLQENAKTVNSIGKALRIRAEERFGWNVISQKTSRIYKEINKKGNIYGPR